MTDKKLMQQALEALNSGVANRANGTDWIEYDSLMVKQAITALRERLTHCDRCGKRLGGEGDIHTCSPQPQQEAVEYWTVAGGWVSERAEISAAAWVEPDFWDHCNRVNCGTAYRLPAPGRQPLYTTPQPAQRTWVGLTDKDKQIIELQSGITEDDDGYIVSQIFRLIEAKLKEKNT